MIERLGDAFSRGEQSSEEKEKANFVRKKVDEIRSSASRVSHEGIWMTNIAAALGLSNMTFNTTSRSFEPIARVGIGLRRDRPQVNKILPTLQNRAARLTKNPPKYDVIPESGALEDKEAARKGLRVLNKIWDQEKINAKRIQQTMWTQECGHSYIKVSWDETKGKPLVNPILDAKDEGEVIAGESLNQGDALKEELVEIQGYEGDVRIDVVSPFEVFPNPHAKNDDDLFSSWLIQAKVRPLEYFTQHYPETGHQVKPEDVWLLSAQYEARVNTMNTRGPSTSTDTSSPKNSAIELVYYEARCPQYPNGRKIAVANGVLLSEGELCDGMIPFAKFDDIVVGGKFYPESVVTHLRPVQERVNDIVARRSEWIRKLLAGKMIVPRGAGLAQESLNNQTEVVYYTPVPNAADGGRPSPLQMPTIPQYAYSEEDKCDQEFNEISGLSEVSKGTLPSASIPAMGMQLLVEQDETRIGVMTTQHEFAWARVGQLILKTIEKGYANPRQLKTRDENGELLHENISGEDLRGNTDVIVVPGSTVAGSKTLKRQEILNAFQQGLLGDPADPAVRQQVLGMLEFGDLADVWLDNTLDATQIKRAMDKLEKEGIPPVLDINDNLLMWKQEVNRFRKSDKFEAMPQIQPIILGLLAQIDQMLQPPMPVPMPGDPAAGEAPPLPEEGAML